MPDMLVKLYQLPEKQTLVESLRAQGVRIVRGLASDKSRAVDFVGEHFTTNWRNACDAAFSSTPVRCYLAVKDKRVIGFACYDVVTRNFFGPTGVLDECRGMGIGKALLLECLHAMRADGYGYAIIGWAEDAIPFYQKTVGATIIPDSFPGIFEDLIMMDLP